MNLEKQLLKEHSKTNTNLITAYIGNDPKKFKKLMDLFFTGEYRVVQRASWSMSDCASTYPTLILPFLDKLVLTLEDNTKHPAVKRNILRILQFTAIPESLQGVLIDICFNFIADRKTPVAIKAFALTVAHNIGKHEPDLMNELKILIEDQIPYTTPAFQSRGNKILKSLSKLSS